jgi:lysophospholipase L1-like esterase
MCVDVAGAPLGKHLTAIRNRWVRAAFLLALTVSGIGAADAGQRCQAPRELVHFKAPLLRMARVMRSETDVRIAALGSSSTAGTGASSPKACYPSQLQAELSRRFPGKSFHVANLGVGGQLARDMLARIDTQVMPLKPSLVIWQTGVNDAMQNVGIDGFRAALARGVDKILAQGVDVILLDMQYFPKGEKLPGYKEYLRVMRQVAEERKIPILHRYDIMKHLVTTAQFTSEQLLANDSFHQNDLGYGCLSDLLADAIEGDLKERLPKTAVHQASSPAGFNPAQTTQMH